MPPPRPPRILCGVCREEGPADYPLFGRPSPDRLSATNSADSKRKNRPHFPFLLDLPPEWIQTYNSTENFETEGEVRSCCFCYETLMQMWGKYESDNVPLDCRRYLSNFTCRVWNSRNPQEANFRQPSSELPLALSSGVPSNSNIIQAAHSNAKKRLSLPPSHFMRSPFDSYAGYNSGLLYSSGGMQQQQQQNTAANFSNAPNSMSGGQRGGETSSTDNGRTAAMPHQDSLNAKFYSSILDSPYSRDALVTFLNSATAAAAAATSGLSANPSNSRGGGGLLQGSIPQHSVASSTVPSHVSGGITGSPSGPLDFTRSLGVDDPSIQAARYEYERLLRAPLVRSVSHQQNIERSDVVSPSHANSTLINSLNSSIFPPPLSSGGGISLNSRKTGGGALPLTVSAVETAVDLTVSSKQHVNNKKQSMSTGVGGVHKSGSVPKGPVGGSRASSQVVPVFLAPHPPPPLFSGGNNLKGQKDGFGVPSVPASTLAQGCFAVPQLPASMLQHSWNSEKNFAFRPRSLSPAHRGKFPHVIHSSAAQAGGVGPPPHPLLQPILSTNASPSSAAAHMGGGGGRINVKSNNDLLLMAAAPSSPSSRVVYNRTLAHHDPSTNLRYLAFNNSRQMDPMFLTPPKIPTPFTTLSQPLPPPHIHTHQFQHQTHHRSGLAAPSSRQQHFPSGAHFHSTAIPPPPLPSPSAAVAALRAASAVKSGGVPHSSPAPPSPACTSSVVVAAASSAALAQLALSSLQSMSTTSAHFLSVGGGASSSSVRSVVKPVDEDHSHLAMPDRNADFEVCYTCGESISRRKQRYHQYLLSGGGASTSSENKMLMCVLTRQLDDVQPYFPSVTLLSRFPHTQPIDSCGRVRACTSCFKHLICQWDEFERRGVSREQRVYNMRRTRAEEGEEFEGGHGSNFASKCSDSDTSKTVVTQANPATTSEETAPTVAVKLLVNDESNAAVIDSSLRMNESVRPTEMDVISSSSDDMLCVVCMRKYSRDTFTCVSTMTVGVGHQSKLAVVGNGKLPAHFPFLKSLTEKCKFAFQRVKSGEESIVKVCQSCASSLNAQWAVHEKGFVPLERRTYEYATPVSVRMMNFRRDLALFAPPPLIVTNASASGRKTVEGGLGLIEEEEGAAACLMYMKKVAQASRNGGSTRTTSCSLSASSNVFKGGVVSIDGGDEEGGVGGRYNNFRPRSNTLDGKPSTSSTTLIPYKCLPHKKQVALREQRNSISISGQEASEVCKEVEEVTTNDNPLVISIPSEQPGKADETSGGVKATEMSGVKGGGGGGGVETSVAAKCSANSGHDNPSSSSSSFHCFLCTFNTELSFARKLYSTPLAKSAPYFPFMKAHNESRKRRGSVSSELCLQEDGSALVCTFCYHSVMSQWKMFNSCLSSLTASSSSVSGLSSSSKTLASSNKAVLAAAAAAASSSCGGGSFDPTLVLPERWTYNITDHMCSICEKQVKRKNIRALSIRECPFLRGSKTRPTIEDGEMAAVCVDCYTKLAPRSSST